MSQDEIGEATVKCSAHVDRHMHEKFRQFFPHQGSMSKLIRFAIAIAIDLKEKGETDDESIGRKFKRALR